MLSLQPRDPAYDWVSFVLFLLRFSSQLLLQRYGGRATTEECPHAIILMCIQSIVGVIIQVLPLLTGIFYFTKSQQIKDINGLLPKDSPLLGHICHSKSRTPGLHGRHCVCQVHEADAQRRDDHVQQERADLAQERRPLPDGQVGALDLDLYLLDVQAWRPAGQPPDWLSRLRISAHQVPPEKKVKRKGSYPPSG